MVNKINIQICVVALLLWLVPMSSYARRHYKKIELKETLRVELNAVLKSASQLHQACFRRDETAIEATMKQLNRKINDAEAMSNMAPVKKTHLLKMLSAARENLEQGRNQKGDDRQRSLGETFRQLVQIVRVFDVKKYRVFFCSKDKKVWLQKSRKAQNPFHPVKFKNCGERA